MSPITIRRHDLARIRETSGAGICLLCADKGRLASETGGGARRLDVSLVDLCGVGSETSGGWCGTIGLLVFAFGEVGLVGNVVRLVMRVTSSR